MLLLTGVAADADLVEKLDQALRSQFVTELPVEAHVVDAARRALFVAGARPSFHSIPGDGIDDDEALCEEVSVTAMQHACFCQLHVVHMCTCHKGKHGECGCRMGVPCGHPVPSLVVELVPESEWDQRGQPTVHPPASWLCATCGLHMQKTLAADKEQQKEGFVVCVPSPKSTGSIGGYRAAMPDFDRHGTAVPVPDKRLLLVEMPRAALHIDFPFGVQDEAQALKVRAGSPLDTHTRVCSPLQRVACCVHVGGDRSAAS